MPRSVADATRFTSTGPYATSKPTTRASTITLQSPAPPNETPQQKVARLREAARRAKLSQESNFDKVVARGRVWADRAHRFTTYSLIGFTGLAGLLAMASLGDMVLYNRKKKAIWLAEKQEEHRQALEIAREAAARGTADEDQILLLNQERAAEDSQKTRAEKKSIFTRAKEYFYSGLSKEEKQDGNTAVVNAAGDGTRGMIPEESRSQPGEGLGILKAVEETKREAQTMLPQVRGGPLDRLGEEAATAVSNNTKSWTSRITGR